MFSQGSTSSCSLCGVPRFHLFVSFSDDAGTSFPPTVFLSWLASRSLVFGIISFSARHSSGIPSFTRPIFPFKGLNSLPLFQDFFEDSVSSLSWRCSRFSSVLYSRAPFLGLWDEGGIPSSLPRLGIYKCFIDVSLMFCSAGHSLASRPSPIRLDLIFPLFLLRGVIFFFFFVFVR